MTVWKNSVNIVREFMLALRMKLAQNSKALRIAASLGSIITNIKFAINSDKLRTTCSQYFHCVIIRKNKLLSDRNRWSLFTENCLKKNILSFTALNKRKSIDMKKELRKTICVIWYWIYPVQINMSSIKFTLLYWVEWMDCGVCVCMLLFWLNKRKRFLYSTQKYKVSYSGRRERKKTPKQTHFQCNIAGYKDVEKGWGRNDENKDKLR